MHLFNIDIKGKITFRESDSFAAGNFLPIFEAKGCCKSALAFAMIKYLKKWRDCTKTKLRRTCRLNSDTAALAAFQHGTRLVPKCAGPDRFTKYGPKCRHFADSP